MKQNSEEEYEADRQRKISRLHQKSNSVYVDTKNEDVSTRSSVIM